MNYRFRMHRLIAQEDRHQDAWQRDQIEAIDRWSPQTSKPMPPMPAMLAGRDWPVVLRGNVPATIGEASHKRPKVGYSFHRGTSSTPAQNPKKQPIDHPSIQIVPTGVPSSFLRIGGPTIPPNIVRDWNRESDTRGPRGEVGPGRWPKMNSQQSQNKGEMPIAAVVRLIDLVNYQDGSVVSRTIVKRSTGTVTLFAFDEGQGLSEHTAAFDAVGHVLEGEAEITVSGKPLRTTTGEAVLLPANQPHTLKALSRFKMVLTMIRSGAASVGDSQ